MNIEKLDFKNPRFSNIRVFEKTDVWKSRIFWNPSFRYSLYSGFPRIRSHFFGYSLLFYMKIEICFLYKGVSYSWEPAVGEYRVFQVFESPASLNLCHSKQCQFPICRVPFDTLASSAEYSASRIFKMKCRYLFKQAARKDSKPSWLCKITNIINWHKPRAIFTVSNKADCSCSFKMA